MDISMEENIPDLRAGTSDPGAGTPYPGTEAAPRAPFIPLLPASAPAQPVPEPVPVPGH